MNQHATTESVTELPAPGEASTEKVVQRAHAFLATLKPSQIDGLLLPHTLRSATTWSNFPEYYLSRGRAGLRTRSMTPAQLAALDQLLAAATSATPTQGIDKIRRHLDIDDYLRTHEGGKPYGRCNFTIAFLGEPSSTGAWLLQFGGHHLALTNAYDHGQLVGATPSFRGMEPFTPIADGGAPDRPEVEEHAAFAALLRSLSDHQRTAAHLGRRVHDLILGPSRDWAFPRAPEGLPARDLSAEQHALLLAAIGRYVGDLPRHDSETIMTRYEHELDATHIACTGSPGLERPGDYIRVDGPSVWLEFSMHDGIVTDDPHPHAVWRDKHTDYGGLRT